MNNYVQLKDGIVFATLSTVGDIEESASIVKVDVEPETLLNKKYINGTFIDAPIIKFAVIDSNYNNTVVEIGRTFYSSEVFGPVIESDDVKVLWTWDGENFNPPVQAPVVELPPLPPIDPPMVFQPEITFVEESEESATTPSEEPTV
jgi:hypothetical protein